MFSFWKGEERCAMCFEIYNSYRLSEITYSRHNYSEKSRGLLTGILGFPLLTQTKQLICL